MQTNYLKYFVDVARLGTAAAAASANYMTPQGISRSLSVLESELGCKLFERQSNKMALSEYGQRILPIAIRMLNVQTDMERSVLDVRELTNKASKLGVVAYLANVAFDSGFIWPMTNEFEGLFANTRLVQCNNAEVLQNLLQENHRDDEVALGLFCFFSPFERENQNAIASLEENGFVYQQYLVSYDMAVVSQHSKLSGKKTISRADMLSHPLIASNDDIAKVLERLYGEDAVSMVTSDSGFRFSMVERNLGISVVPAFSQILSYGDFGEFHGVKAVPLKEPYYLEIGFAAKREVHDNEYVKEFFQRLTSFYSQFTDTPYISLASSDLTMRNDGSASGNNNEAVLRTAAERYGLTKREEETLEMLMADASTSFIAEQLGTALSTVKSHEYSIYSKMDVHSHGELTLLLDEIAKGEDDLQSRQ